MKINRISPLSLSLIASLSLMSSCANGSDKPMPMRDITSEEVVKEMKIGWNLGNTFDANTDKIEDGEPSEYETAWGNPETTKEMVDGIKASGFNTFRIPITWTNHFSEATDCIIDKDWLERIREVVDYGIENGMYVIINSHHDTWYVPSEENFENACNVMTSLWTQIAIYFRNYDEHLIFEGMNEPRLIGTSLEWNGGDDTSRGIVNQLNALFVETVRAAGGNNQLRHLMVPPYAASGTADAINGLELPDDEKLIVSIHAYTPYDFALNTKGTDQWDCANSADTDSIDMLMELLDKRFVSNGIPVVIGEFGALNKSNSEQRCDWTEYYVRAAAQKNITCIWWDNGTFYGSGERLGIFDRELREWVYPEILEAMMNGIK